MIDTPLSYRSLDLIY